jgi:hypothetical protein
MMWSGKGHAHPITVLACGSMLDVVHAWHVGVVCVLEHAHGVGWCAGVLVCGCAGVRVCWCDDVLVCWCAGVRVCGCAGVLACWCAGVLVCGRAGVLVCWCTGVGWGCGH